MLAPSGLWRACTVVAEAPAWAQAGAPAAGAPAQLRVHYVGFEARWDEWLAADDPRLRYAPVAGDDAAQHVVRGALDAIVARSQARSPTSVRRPVCFSSHPMY